MKRSSFADNVCPIARTTDLMGDWWTPLVMREFLVGPRRFDQLQERLGVSRATLSQRLDKLVAEELLATREYQDNPPRHEYFLTERGVAFWNVLAAMWAFGEEWLFGDKGPKVALKDRTTGQRVRVKVVNADTGEPLNVGRLRMGRASTLPPEQRRVPSEGDHAEG